MSTQPAGGREAEIDRLFAEVLELPVGERDSWVDTLGARDADAAAAVRRLLELAGQPDARLATGRWVDGAVWEELTRGGPMRSALRGERIGAYRILDEIDHGGMSVVYLAERADGVFDQRVAIKFLGRAGARETGLRRFEQERQILAGLNHPNIARLLDGGTDEHGFPYIVMEYVAGRPIDDYCWAFGADLERQLDLFDVVAGAVEYAHRHLVVHRDLKPGNILVTDDGQVKLLDFGIAKLLEPAFAGDFAAPPTQPLLRFLTPEYASPEQVRGGPVTTASDVYQLGALLYELLTGRRLYSFENATISQIERAICEEQPLRPSLTGNAREPGDAGAAPQAAQPLGVSRRLRGDLDNIVMKTLEKQPERRYAAVGELRDDLRRFRQGLPVRARHPTVWYRTTKFVRRHRAGVAIAALLLLFLFGYAATVTMQARRIAAEAARTERVKDFLTSLFTLANPGVTRGETPTIVDMVDAGAHRVAVEFSDQPDLQAEMMTMLGQVYVALGRYDAAVEQLRPALEIRTRFLGVDHSDVIRSAYLLGEALHYGGWYSEAEQLLRRAVDAQARVFGESSPELARALNLLGDLLHSRGELVEAEAALRRALSVQIAMKGDDAVDVAVTRRDLATVLRDRGAAGEAEAMFRRSLDVLQPRFGSVDPIVARTRGELALLLAESGEHEEAEALLNENFAAYRKLYPRGHAMEGTMLRNLGVLRLRESRPVEADRELERALENYGRTLSPDNALIPRVQRYRAEAALGMGNTQAAVALAEEALDRLRKAGLSVHPAIADALETLGLAKLAQGRTAEAADLLAQSLAVRTQSSVASDPRLEITRSHLARARGVQGSARHAGARGVATR
jgi:serine/threonine protein kinase/tetratricopeptide (TPR) repeat protein